MAGAAVFINPNALPKLGNLYSRWSFPATTVQPGRGLFVHQQDPPRLSQAGLAVLDFKLGVVAAVAHPEPANWLLACVEDLCEVLAMRLASVAIKASAVVRRAVTLHGVIVARKVARASTSDFTFL